MSWADVMTDEMYPDHEDIRLTGTSDKDAPMIKAVRGYGTRHDRDGTALAQLLADGADVNVQDKQGSTPLMLACKSVNEGLARQLLEVKGIDLDLQNKRGFTALMIAATKQWCGSWTLTPLVRELLDRGADVNIQDDGGRTVWGVAIDKQNEEVLSLLHERGHSYETSGMTLPVVRMQHPKYGPWTWKGGESGERMPLPIVDPEEDPYTYQLAKAGLTEEEWAGYERGKELAEAQQEEEQVRWGFPPKEQRARMIR